MRSPGRKTFTEGLNGNDLPDDVCEDLCGETKATCPQDCSNGDASDMANPASVYCEKNNGKLEIRTDDLGEDGVCIFQDGAAYLNVLQVNWCNLC
ncbi:MAG: DUF333 domain-containing protein [Candidatus Dojkabacteria bacterium]